MSEEKREKGNPHPKSISPALCKAYRDTLKAEIKGLRNTIIVGLSIATAVITIVQYVLAVM